MSEGLRLTNTLTRSKEAFVPIDPNNVRMYVCGPTVYDFAHIGNARPVIVFDVLFRLLRHLYPGAGTASDGSRVTYVRNITDVDDKINARALRDFGTEVEAGRLTLNEAIRKVTQATADQFSADVKALGCLEPTHEPRATDFVMPRGDGGTDMVQLIQSLIERGHAYAAEGEILFDIASMQDYGRLSRRNLEEQQAGARVAVDAHKKNPADFVLWKQSSAEEPGWNAVFRIDGRDVAIRGRPGWHIECSAMSDALLWEAAKDRLSPEALARPHQFDIHGGGLDLIFPHHENEIAQSRCAHGTGVMANYWMHNGFLQVEGRKMSKSEGNFVTIQELLHTDKFGRRKWPGEVLRLAMLMTHYREPIDFSLRRLEEADDSISKWRRTIAESHWKGGSLVEVPARAGVVEALSDDLNTPIAISEAQKSHAFARRFRGDPQNDSIARLVRTLSLLGFDARSWVEEERHTLSSALRTMLPHHVKSRLAFIREKNWAEADRIRDELLAQGIQLKDGRDPVSGERVTTWEVKR